MPIPKGVDAKKYDDCVDQVKAKGNASNAYAVCASSLEDAFKKKHAPECQCEAHKPHLFHGEESFLRKSKKESISASGQPQLTRSGAKK